MASRTSRAPSVRSSGASGRLLPWALLTLVSGAALAAPTVPGLPAQGGDAGRELRQLQNEVERQRAASALVRCRTSTSSARCSKRRCRSLTSRSSRLGTLRTRS
ncbi:hypothetical protein HMPREF9440_02053 [Sutterella parvirubra YIT 11816]|uniref:Tat pathway signal sequence domain protein n=1 Tax=Sutterella parvirubra YIT 11816 TaxID=762967 RepID=H3KH13_9BURK|nr:hypothetical protein HMPREF9440_02053 [Sutterella parvirubra YIT 11816]